MQTMHTTERLRERFSARVNEQIDTIARSFHEILQSAGMGDSEIPPDVANIGKERFQSDLQARKLVLASEKLLGIIGDLKTAAIMNDHIGLDHETTATEGSIDAQRTVNLALLEEVDKQLSEQLYNAEKLFYSKLKPSMTDGSANDPMEE